MEEKKAERINVGDLPRGEEELTAEEARGVQGGLPAVQSAREAARVNTTTSQVDDNLVQGNLTGTE